jgi:hypothetical protein
MKISKGFSGLFFLSQVARDIAAFGFYDLKKGCARTIDNANVADHIMGAHLSSRKKGYRAAPKKAAPAF